MAFVSFLQLELRLGGRLFFARAVPTLLGHASQAITVLTVTRSSHSSYISVRRGYLDLQPRDDGVMQAKLGTYMPCSDLHQRVVFLVGDLLLWCPHCLGVRGGLGKQDCIQIDRRSRYTRVSSDSEKVCFAWSYADICNTPARCMSPPASKRSTKAKTHNTLHM